MNGLFFNCEFFFLVCISNGFEGFFECNNEPLSTAPVKVKGEWMKNSEGKGGGGKQQKTVNHKDTPLLDDDTETKL